MLPSLRFVDHKQSIKNDFLYRAIPFRAYYRLRAYRYYFFRCPDLKLLTFLVPKNKVSLDVGAHLGVYSYFLSRLSHQVHAFEPNPLNFRILRSIVDSNVVPHNKAVSNFSGEAELMVPRSNKGWTSNGASLSKKLQNGGTLLNVPCTKIDDLKDLTIGFIKIDIEGHEKEALEGALQVIETQRPNIILENEYFHTGEKWREVFNIMEHLNYKGFFLQDGMLTNLNQFSIEKHQLQAKNKSDASIYTKNFIFLPR